MMNGQKRQRLEIDTWRGLMRRFDASGTSVSAFCAQEGLSVSSFYRWRSLLEAGHDSPGAEGQMRADAAPLRPAAGFIDLGHLMGPSAEAGDQAALELRLDLGGGVVLHLSRR